MIILAAYLFLWFNSLFATILSIILIFILIPIAAYLFYHRGVFLNIIFPILGIVLHKIIADAEDMFEHIKK